MVKFSDTDKPATDRTMGEAVGRVEPITRQDPDSPGLRLTLAQIGRLWEWPAPPCRELIGKLVERGHMAQTPDGLYFMVRGLRRVRRDTGRPCAS